VGVEVPDSGDDTQRGTADAQGVPQELPSHRVEGLDEIYEAGVELSCLELFVFLAESTKGEDCVGGAAGCAEAMVVSHTVSSTMGARRLVGPS